MRNLLYSRQVRSRSESTTHLGRSFGLARHGNSPLLLDPRGNHVGNLASLQVDALEHRIGQCEKGSKRVGLPIRWNDPGPAHELVS